MKAGTTELRQKLRIAGLTEQAVNAAWPAWWSEKATSSPAAQAELRFAVARKLGVSASALARDEVEFIWRDQARFKHLRNETADEQAALASFGTGVANHVAAATQGLPSLPLPTAAELRQAVLASHAFVDLHGLISTCWAVGIPVIHLRVFPLEAKSMHAMVVRVGERYVVLLARDAKYPAQVAFTLAHEIGHIALGHLGEGASIIDLEDPASANSQDNEERSADDFALELLTGSSRPNIIPEIANPSNRALADAVMQAGPLHAIEPGTLALCFGYQTGNWSAAIGSLRHIYSRPQEVWVAVNRVAEAAIDWRSVSEDTQDYLLRVIGIDE